MVSSKGKLSVNIEIKGGEKIYPGIVDELAKGTESFGYNNILFSSFDRDTIILLKEKYPEQWQIWEKKPAELMLPGRETLQELQERMLAGMASIAESRRLKAALVVTHISNLRVVALHAAGMGLHEYKSIHVDNCKVFTFDNFKLPHNKAI